MIVGANKSQYPDLAESCNRRTATVTVGAKSAKATATESGSPASSSKGRKPSAGAMNTPSMIFAIPSRTTANNSHNQNSLRLAVPDIETYLRKQRATILKSFMLTSYQRQASG